MIETNERQQGGSAAPPTESRTGEASAPASAKTDRGAAVAPGKAPPQRTHPAHLPNVARHNQAVILFVTVCTKDRRGILASERVQAALVRAWPQARQYRVGRYILMPDHLHLFCSPAVHGSENVKRWVAYWKRLVSLALADLQPIWQRDCWDTQLRQARHYDEKWVYVERNPVRKGLAANPQDWPYQGCLNELRW
jgi:putative transposase